MFILRWNYVMAKMGTKMQQWKQQQRLVPSGPLSNVDLCVQLVELIDQQQEPV